MIKAFTDLCTRNLSGMTRLNINVSIKRPLRGAAGMAGIASVMHNNFSRQKILAQVWNFEQQVTASKSHRTIQAQSGRRQPNQASISHDGLIRDYLELTEESFDEHLSLKMASSEPIDTHMLMMIVSSLSNPSTIRKHIPRLYDSMHVFDKEELLLLMQLIVAYRPEKKPQYVPVSKNLNNI